MSVSRKGIVHLSGENGLCVCQGKGDFVSVRGNGTMLKEKGLCVCQGK